MKVRPKLPVFLTAGSFLLLAGVAAFSSPADSLIFSAIFFITLLIFLISAGYAYDSLRGHRSKVNRHRVVISLFIVIALMFRSSQSLSWVDGLILILTVGGVIFYLDQRFAG